MSLAWEDSHPTVEEGIASVDKTLRIWEHEGMALSRETGRKETESSMESGDKLVTPARFILDVADFLARGNTRKKRNTNT